MTLPPAPGLAPMAGSPAQSQSKSVSGLKRVLSNLAHLLGGKVAAGLMSLIYLVIVARTLGARDYGELVLINGYTLFVGSLIAFSYLDQVIFAARAPAGAPEGGTLALPPASSPGLASPSSQASIRLSSPASSTSWGSISSRTSTVPISRCATAGLAPEGCLLALSFAPLVQHRPLLWIVRNSLRLPKYGGMTSIVLRIETPRDGGQQHVVYRRQTTSLETPPIQSLTQDHQVWSRYPQ